MSAKAKIDDPDQPVAWMLLAVEGKNRLTSNASDKRSWERHGHNVVPLYTRPGAAA